MISVREAVTDEDFDSVRQLMRAFINWHYQRHVGDEHLIDGYFDHAEFERELASLPGQFAPPSGRVLLARNDESVAGCVALKDLGDGICEMKRMFVYPTFHGCGAGLALGRAIISEARAIGYRLMRLDTGARQAEAKGLYRKLGFREIPPYYELPPDMRDWLTFMELDLRLAPSSSDGH